MLSVAGSFGRGFDSRRLHHIYSVRLQRWRRASRAVIRTETEGCANVFEQLHAAKGFSSGAGAWPLSIWIVLWKQQRTCFTDKGVIPVRFQFQGFRGCLAWRVLPSPSRPEGVGLVAVTAIPSRNHSVAV